MRPARRCRRVASRCKLSAVLHRQGRDGCIGCNRCTGFLCNVDLVRRLRRACLWALGVGHGAVQSVRRSASTALPAVSAVGGAVVAPGAVALCCVVARWLWVPESPQPPENCTPTCSWSRLFTWRRIAPHCCASDTRRPLTLRLMEAATWPAETLGCRDLAMALLCLHRSRVQPPRPRCVVRWAAG